MRHRSCKPNKHIYVSKGEIGGIIYNHDDGPEPGEEGMNYQLEIDCCSKCGKVIYNYAFRWEWQNVWHYIQTDVGHVPESKIAEVMFSDGIHFAEKEYHEGH